MKTARRRAVADAAPNFSSNSSEGARGPSVAPLLALAAVCLRRRATRCRADVRCRRRHVGGRARIRRWRTPRRPRSARPRSSRNCRLNPSAWCLVCRVSAPRHRIRDRPARFSRRAARVARPRARRRRARTRRRRREDPGRRLHVARAAGAPRRTHPHEVSARRRCRLDHFGSYTRVRISPSSTRRPDRGSKRRTARTRTRGRRASAVRIRSAAIGAAPDPFGLRALRRRGRRRRGRRQFGSVRRAGQRAGRVSRGVRRVGGRGVGRVPAATTSRSPAFARR